MGLIDNILPKAEYDFVNVCVRCKRPVFFNLNEYHDWKHCPDCGVPFPFVFMKVSKWEKMGAEKQEKHIKRVLSSFKGELFLKPGEVCRKKCKVCGEVWCYTEEDIKASQKRARASALHSFSGAMSGNLLVMQTSSVAANQNADKVIDFSKCPRCGSKDIRDLDESEWPTEQAKATQGSAPASAVSAADELKKFKDLLDMGVITQEEFDAKKKQLLGL